MMLFDGVIQRKLASLLRPWLSQEPDWEVNLGFFRSLVVARHLRFDVSALNRLIGGGEDLSLLFKSVTVDELTLRVAHLSAPAFTLDVRGFSVTLFPEGGARRNVSKRVEESLDDYLHERKIKILAQIDPEGVALDDSMKMAMAPPPLKTRLKNSITNLVLAHCSLHLHDVHVRVEFPVSDDKFSWLCSIRELNAESSHNKIGCFLAGFVGSVFLPFREISYNLEATVVEIGAEKKDHRSSIVSFVNPQVGIKLKDLHLVSLILSVPEVDFSLSPGLLQKIIAFSRLFCIECKHIRSGRLLWEIARSKMHSILLPPAYSFYKVVVVAIHWLRFVKEYQHLLASVGYSNIGIKMSDGHNLPRRVKQHWKVISKMEKDLPAEALASARQVSRYRAALEGNCESSPGRHFNSCWRFFPLVVIWAVILRIFTIFMTIFFPYERGMTVEFSDAKMCFFLSVGKISTVIASSDACFPLIHKISNSRNKNYVMHPLSFDLVARDLLYVFEEGIWKQYMSFSVGFLEILSMPPLTATANDSSNVGGALEGPSKERLHNSKTIVWGEPALMCIPSEDEDPGNAAKSFLKQTLEEIEHLQKRLHGRFQDVKAHDNTNPWAICDVRTFRLYPGIKSPDSGFLKSSLLVGKLNFTLGCSQLLAVATLMGLLELAVLQLEGSDSAVFQEHPGRTFQDSLKMSWSRGLKSFVKQKRTRLSKLISDKHVELRAVLAGPCIRLSLTNEELSSSSMEANVKDGSAGINLTISIHDSEFAIWPMAESAVPTCGEPHRLDDLIPDFLKLKESMINEYHPELEDVNYTSKGQILLCYFLTLGGLNAYFEDPVESHMLQFLLLKPLTAKFTSLRESLHSFGRSVVTSSVSFSGAMAGVTAFFYMDELCIYFQVVERFISAALINGSEYSGAGTSHNRQVIVYHGMPLMELAIEETVIGICEGEALDPGTALCVVSFELAQFDINIHNSRNGTDKKNLFTIFDACRTRKPVLDELPDSGIRFSIEKTCLGISVRETNVEIDVDIRRFWARTFRCKNQIGHNDNSEVEDTVLQSNESIDYLHEVSLSSCKFTLLLDFLNDSEALSGTDSATSSNNHKGLFSNTLFSTIDTEGLRPESIQDNSFVSVVSALMPSAWLLTHIAVGTVFVGICSVKDEIIKAHPVEEMHLSLSVGGDFQSICLRIQGGSIFIEAAALTRFTLCVTSYHQFIRSLLHAKIPHSKYVEPSKPGSGVPVMDRDYFEERGRRETDVAHSVNWELLEAFSTNLSQFSLVLLTTDESGRC